MASLPNSRDICLTASEFHPMHQDQEHQHGTCAAELPGICDVNLVSHTMGDGISPSAWSRGICKRENPTQGAPIRAMVSGWPVRRQHADKKQQRIETSDANRQG